MKKITIAASLALLATAGTAALAAHHMGDGKDPMGDKTITRAEMQQHSAEMFAKFDVNKDGKLDAADRAAHHGEMFDKLDADKNGAISRDEFAAHKPGPDGEGRGDGHKGRHGDGMKGRHGGMAMMMLRKADANGDKAVTRAEFDTAAAQHFDQVDTNKDGQITPAERKAAHEKMRTMMRAMKDRQG